MVSVSFWRGCPASVRVWSAFLVCMIASVIPAFAQQLPSQDKTRIAEFYRFAAATQDKLWPAWSTVPVPLVVITQSGEFLTHPSGDPQGFKSVGDGSFWRERHLPVNMMITIPAAGMHSVIFMGEPVNTDAKNSTSWIMFAMHEHFHQLQQAQPGYYQHLQALGLFRGADTGNRMINYPFPYSDDKIDAEFDRLRVLLLHTLAEKDTAAFQHRAADYIAARKEFMNSLSADDRNYIEFQIGQEGVARYVQVRAAELGKSYRPTRPFKKLPDYVSFKELGSHLREQTLQELRNTELSTAKRAAVYSFGAAEGMLLDRIHPGWTHHYFEHMFALAPLFEGGEEN